MIEESTYSATFKIPRSSLPAEIDEINRLLSGYFADSRVTLRPFDTFLDVDCLYTGKQWWDIDPNIEKFLPSFQQKFRKYGDKRSFTDHKIFVCLNDSRSLEALNLLLNQTNDNSDFTIIHIDSHSDLMSPLLGHSSKGVHMNLIDKSQFCMTSFEAVRRSIDTGAVGIGGFLTPFLCCDKINVSLIHVCPDEFQSAKFPIGSGYLNYTPVFDKILAPDYLRHGWTRNSSNSGKIAQIVTPIQSLDYSFCKINSPVLHIDLDYFNNRYDGDSDWMNRPGRYDPTIAEALVAVERLFSKLLVSGLRSISALIIACSPGFCPSEYWEPLTKKILRQAAQFLK